jgi:DNA-binding response OmpR family regulator
MNKVVMVVDDEPEIIRIVKIALVLENYCVIEATNGEECLSMLESNENPCLILLDIMMFGITGYDLFKKIRENERFKNIKIAFFSAMAQNQDIEKGLALGVDDYITKPFDPYELVVRVTNILKVVEGKRHGEVSKENIATETASRIVPGRNQQVHLRNL